MPSVLTILPVVGMGEIHAGDDLATIILSCLDMEGIRLFTGDILVVAQKIVSKAEGRVVDLAGTTASPEAEALASQTGKDANLVELILGQSDIVMRAKQNVMIVRHKLGLVMANAGIDRSNVPSGDEFGNEGSDQVLLLPVDPDRSASELRLSIADQTGVDVGVIISDSFGRAWRKGVVNVAIGAAGIASLVDRRGELDRQCRPLLMTEVAHADAVAAAAGIVMGEGAEGCPVVIVRGAPEFAPPCNASTLIRPLTEDMFP